MKISRSSTSDSQETVFALKEARPRIQSLKTLNFRWFPKKAEDFRTLLRTIRRCFDQRATYLIVEVSNITSKVIDIITRKNYRNFTREKLWLLSGLEIIRSSYIETTIGWFWERAVLLTLYVTITRWRHGEYSFLCLFEVKPLFYECMNIICKSWKRNIIVIKKIRLFFPNL